MQPERVEHGVVHLRAERADSNVRATERDAVGEERDDVVATVTIQSIAPTRLRVDARYKMPEGVFMLMLTSVSMA